VKGGHQGLQAVLVPVRKGNGLAGVPHLAALPPRTRRRLLLRRWRGRRPCEAAVLPTGQELPWVAWAALAPAGHPAPAGLLLLLSMLPLLCALAQAGQPLHQLPSRWPGCWLGCHALLIEVCHRLGAVLRHPQLWAAAGILQARVLACSRPGATRRAGRLALLSAGSCPAWGATTPGPAPWLASRRLARGPAPQTMRPAAAGAVWHSQLGRSMARRATTCGPWRGELLTACGPWRAKLPPAALGPRTPCMPPQALPRPRFPSRAEPSLACCAPPRASSPQALPITHCPGHRKSYPWVRRVPVQISLRSTPKLKMSTLGVQFSPASSSGAICSAGGAAPGVKPACCAALPWLRCHGWAATGAAAQLGAAETDRVGWWWLAGRRPAGHCLCGTYVGKRPWWAHVVAQRVMSTGSHPAATRMGVYVPNVRQRGSTSAAAKPGCRPLASLGRRDAPNHSVFHKLGKPKGRQGAWGRWVLSMAHELCIAGGRLRPSRRTWPALHRLSWR
jgi:hypothetical protein